MQRTLIAFWQKEWDENRQSTYNEILRNFELKSECAFLSFKYSFNQKRYRLKK